MNKLIHSQVKRLLLTDVVYFVTTNIKNRQMVFADERNVVLLREVLRVVKEVHPFKMRAYAFMPDHLHLLIHVLAETNLNKLMQARKRNFTRE